MSQFSAVGPAGGGGDCRLHPGISAVDRCAGCAEPFCGNCLVDMGGRHYCGQCKIMGVPGGKISMIPTGTGPSFLCTEAKTALILSIIGMFIGLFCNVGMLMGIIAEIIAIVMSIQAKKKIAADPRLTGAAMATSALVIGIVMAIMTGVVMISTVGK